MSHAKKVRATWASQPRDKNRAGINRLKQAYKAAKQGNERTYTRSEVNAMLQSVRAKASNEENLNIESEFELVDTEAMRVDAELERVFRETHMM